MTRDEILDRLRRLRHLSQRALDLLEPGRIITAEASEELRDIVPRLKSGIRAEYKRMSPIGVQEKMSPEESTYYFPANQEAYFETGLNTFRTERKPKEEWYGIIKAANAKLQHYLHQLESQTERIARSQSCTED